MNREEFLARLRARPAGRHLGEEPAPPDLPPPPDDLVAAFEAQAAAAGCRVVEGSFGELRDALRREVGDEKVLVGAEDEVQRLCEGLGAVPAWEPFTAAFGVALADGALARTGGTCFVRRPASPLTPTLVPPRCAVLVPVSRLVWDLADYLREPPVGGSIAVVSGPSRSADIENDLSIGVHGPGDVLLLVWRDDAEAADGADHSSPSK